MNPIKARALSAIARPSRTLVFMFFLFTPPREFAQKFQGGQNRPLQISEYPREAIEPGSLQLFDTPVPPRLNPGNEIAPSNRERALVTLSPSQPKREQSGMR